MEKRLLLAMILCLLILLVYQSYVEKQNEKWRAAHPELAEEGLQGTATDPGRMDFEGRVASESPAEALVPEERAPSEVPRDVSCEEVIVDTPLYQAVFCSGNGRRKVGRIR